MVAGYLILAGMVVVGIASIVYAIYALPATSDADNDNIPPPGLY